MHRVSPVDIYHSQRSPQYRRFFSNSASAVAGDEGNLVTERQIDLLQLLVEGKSMKEDVLNLTARTVAFHKHKLMNALNLDTNAEVGLATVLLLVAMSQQFRSQRLRMTLVALAFVLLFFPLWSVLALPRA